MRLNPYYNGKYSMSNTNTMRCTELRGLNPYYNGKYSMSAAHKPAQHRSCIGLNPYYNGKYSMRGKNILN